MAFNVTLASSTRAVTLSLMKGSRHVRLTPSAFNRLLRHGTGFNDILSRGGMIGFRMPHNMHDMRFYSHLQIDARCQVRPGSAFEVGSSINLCVSAARF